MKTGKDDYTHAKDKYKSVSLLIYSSENSLEFVFHFGSFPYYKLLSILIADFFSVLFF